MRTQCRLLRACRDTTCTELRIEACISCTCTTFGLENMGRESNVCVIAIALHTLVLMYNLANPYLNTYSFVIIAVLYFHVSCGRPALPAPLPAAISLLSFPLSQQMAPFWGWLAYPCNHYISIPNTLWAPTPSNTKSVAFRLLVGR
jgi:hypothetical protein